MKEEILNLPNAITSIRLMLVPFFAYMLVNEQNIIALTLFLIIFFTDIIDGFLSRALKQETEFGANFDALVDGIFILTGLVILTYLNRLNALLMILLFLPRAVIFAKEIIAYSKEGLKKFKPTLYRRGITGLTAALIIIGIIKEDANTFAIPIIILAYLLILLESINH